MNITEKYSCIEIVIDNIQRIKTRECFSSFDALFRHTQINTSTLRNWMSHHTYPPLKKLDSFADAFSIHTSDLFIIDSTFEHPYCHLNNSAETFRLNFNSICLDQKIISRNEKAIIIGNEDLFRTYFYQKRPIPISRLDEIAIRLGIETYKLLI